MATPIASSTRYINPEITLIYFVLEIDDKNAPSRSELDEGTDITCEVMEMSGFSVTSNQVETPDLCSRYTSQIPGRITAEDSSITFYADREGQAVQTLLPRNETGFIVILDQGEYTSASPRVMDVYPVTVMSQSKSRSVDGSSAASINVQFSITSEPAENVLVPVGDEE